MPPAPSSFRMEYGPRRLISPGPAPEAGEAGKPPVAGGGGVAQDGEDEPGTVDGGVCSRSITPSTTARSPSGISAGSGGWSPGSTRGLAGRPGLSRQQRSVFAHNQPRKG